MAVPRAYLQVGWLLGTVMLLGVVSRRCCLASACCAVMLTLQCIFFNAIVASGGMPQCCYLVQNALLFVSLHTDC
jgi:hypothetical protein